MKSCKHDHRVGVAPTLRSGILFSVGLSIVICFGSYVGAWLPEDEVGECLFAGITLAIALITQRIFEQSAVNLEWHWDDRVRPWAASVCGVLLGAFVGFVGKMALGGFSRHQTNADIALVGLAATVTVEEVVFRWIAWRWLRRNGLVLTIVVTSLLFAAVHLPQRLHVWFVAPSEFLLGMCITIAWGIVFGCLREYLGIGSSIACHFGDDLAMELGW